MVLNFRVPRVHLALTSRRDPNPHDRGMFKIRALDKVLTKSRTPFWAFIVDFTHSRVVHMQTWESKHMEINLILKNGFLSNFYFKY
jgi:hypothetical protein